MLKTKWQNYSSPPLKKPPKPEDERVVARERQEKGMSWFSFSQEQTREKDSGASGLCGRGPQGILGRGRGDRKQEEGKPYTVSCQGGGDWRAIPLGDYRRSRTEFSN